MQRTNYYVHANVHLSITLNFLKLQKTHMERLTRRNDIHYW